MYNKKSIAEYGGHRRKSARILALEEKENEKRKLRPPTSKGKSGEGTNSESFQNPQIKHRVSSTQPSTLKRGRKQKRLEDIDFPSLNENLYQQDGETSKDQNQSIRTDQHINGLSVIPEQRLLDFALAVLQRRDTYSIFAHPVDPNEVENYDSIVKEPMDFSTMKTKLQEGKYTSLDQFESDVFLICSNAMIFNSSTTVYYKEARAMQMLAQTVFSSLRNDPSNFVSEFSFARGRCGRKLAKKIEIKGTPSRTPRQTGLRIGASSLGPRIADDSTLTKRDDPQFYRPWTSFLNESENLVSTVYNAEKTLELDDENVESRYRRSLVWFARGLGPIPTKEAAKKVVKCISQAQPPSQNPQRPVPTLPSAQRTAFPNAQSPIGSLQSLPGNSLLGRNTFLNLNVKASSSFDRNTARDLMPPPKEPISQTRNNHALGKRPMLDNNVAHNSLISQAIHHEKFLGKMPMLDQNIDRNTLNSSIFSGSSRENRAYPSDYSSSYLPPYVHPAQNFAPQKELQTQNGEFWLASHLKVIPVEDKNNPSRKNFVTVDMLAESDDQTEKQGPELDYPELSANWKSRLRGFVNRGNNFINSLDLFGGPSETTPNTAQSYGRPSSAQGLVSPDRWTSLTNSNNYPFDSTQFGQPSSDVFPSKETFATLDMLLTHEYTPLPSYDELGYAPAKPAKKTNDHPRGTLSVNKNVGSIVKDVDHGPNLSLQL